MEGKEEALTGGRIERAEEIGGRWQQERKERMDEFNSLFAFYAICNMLSAC
jgi:hypothetical protein